MEMNGRWKWICEVERRRRGHCTSLLEGINRNTLLRECLIELNLVFDTLYFFSFFLLTPFCLFVCMFIYLQVTTGYHGDSVEFVRLEELTSPSVSEIEGEEGMEW